MKKHLIIAIMAIVNLNVINDCYSQLLISSTNTPAQSIQNVLVGGGINISNVTFQGIYSSSSISQFGEFVNGYTTNLEINEGIIIASGDVYNIPNVSGVLMSTDASGNGCAEITALTGNTSYDAAVIEFDFVPYDNKITLNYIFASEEYNDYVNSTFNDAFGFFINGPKPSGGIYNNFNIALIPGTSFIPVSINNVNNGYSVNCSSGPCTNCDYFIDNCNGNQIIFDGFTKPLIAHCDVIPNQTYHIKLAVADVGDGVLDSGVFLKTGTFFSFSSHINISYSNPVNNSSIEGCNNAIVYISADSTSSLPQVIHYTINGSSTNGIDFFFVADSVIIPAGSLDTNLIISPIDDSFNEGTETLIFTYVSSAGNTERDTVFINDKATPIEAGADQTICYGDSILLSASNGNTYTWNNGINDGEFFTPPLGINNYIVTGIDICGQPSSDSLSVFVYTMDYFSVSNSGDTAIVTLLPAASYIWMNCDNNTIVPGATNPTFVPSTTGNYAVIVSQNNCIDTSECIYINSVKVQYLSVFNHFTAFPNPFNEILMLNIPSEIETTISITDIQGRAYLKPVKISSNPYTINTSLFEKGMYFLKISNKYEISVYKILK